MVYKAPDVSLAWDLKCITDVYSGSLLTSYRDFLVAKGWNLKAYLSPNGEENDVIAAASVMLESLTSTRIVMTWETGYELPFLTKEDIHAAETATFALRHFKASHGNASPIACFVERQASMGYISSGPMTASYKETSSCRSSELSH